MIFLFPVYSQNVYVHIVDMSSARQVWEFAHNFSSNNSVHVLVCDTVCTSLGSSVAHTLILYSNLMIYSPD